MNQFASRPPSTSAEAGWPEPRRATLMTVSAFPQTEPRCRHRGRDRRPLGANDDTQLHQTSTARPARGGATKPPSAGQASRLDAGFNLLALIGYQDRYRPVTSPPG